MEKLFEFIETHYETALYDNSNSLDDEFSELVFDNTTFKIPIKDMLENGFKRRYTDNTENIFKENYANPFASVHMFRLIFTLVKDGDKIGFKLFKYRRNRNVGKKYFKTQTSLNFLSYNIKTNALYVGELRNYHLKRKCVKKCQRVLLTQDWISNITSILNSYLTPPLTPINEMNDAIRLFVDSIPGIKKYDGEPKMVFYKHFLERSGVKLPNNWDTFICVYPQPTKKLLEKTKYKYIDSIMELHKLKGDKIRRCLHLVNNMDVDSLFLAYHIFGQKYILSKPDEDLVKILQFTPLYTNDIGFNLNGYSKNEKERAYSIYVESLMGNIDFTTFVDHIRFKSKLSNIDPVKWKSKTIDEFNDEHYDWSEKVAGLQKCQYERFYGSDFKDWVEQIIPVEDVDYYPVLLTNSSEYNLESITQNNCVRTYIDKPSALIVSFRSGSKTSKDKLTVEYNIVCTDLETKDMTLKRVQTRKKSNMMPDPEWDEPLRLLDLRINELCKQNLFILPKLLITFNNNIKVESELSIEDNGFIRWNNDYIQKRGNDIIFDFDDLP